MLLTGAPLNSKANHEMTQLMIFKIVFNSDDVWELQSSCHVRGHPGCAALLCTPLVVPLALNSRDGVTHTVPIFKGYTLPHAILCLSLAGRDPTDSLRKILRD